MGFLSNQKGSSPKRDQPHIFPRKNSSGAPLQELPPPADWCWKRTRVNLTETACWCDPGITESEFGEGTTFWGFPYKGNQILGIEPALAWKPETPVYLFSLSGFGSCKLQTAFRISDLLAPLGENGHSLGTKNPRPRHAEACIRPRAWSGFHQAGRVTSTPWRARRRDRFLSPGLVDISLTIQQLRDVFLAHCSWASLSSCTAPG